MDKFSKMEFRNQSILFTDLRVRDRKPGLNYYDIRHDDEEWLPCTIEKGVLVNHFGTIISKDKLDLDNLSWNDSSYILLGEDEKIDFISPSESATIEEYLEEVGEGIQCRIFIGPAYIDIKGKKYMVHVLDRTDHYMNKGSAYIFNDLVLPYNGKLQQSVNTYLQAGLYKHNEHLLMIFPSEDEIHLYNISNVEG